MTVKIEQILINKILLGEVKLSEILEMEFDVRCLSHLREPYEYIYNQVLQENKLPDKELIITRYPFMDLSLNAEIKTVEIIDSLMVGSEKDRLYNDLQKAVQLYQKSDSSKPVIEFLKKQIKSYEKIETEKDVYDLTSDSDLAELDRLGEERRKTLLDGGRVGIDSGFGDELNFWLNGGWQNGQFYMWSAPLGTGKTWACVRSCVGAFKQGKIPFFLGLESTLENEGFRVLSATEGVENDKLHKGIENRIIVDGIDVDEFKWAQYKLKEFSQKTNTHFYLALRGKNYRYTVDKLYNYLLKYKPDLCVIDYLTLLSLDTSSTKMEWSDYNEISKSLKSIAVALNIPLIVANQTDKQSLQKDILSTSDSSYFGPQRDCDGILGIVKIKGEKEKIRINSIKGRNTRDDFDAVYQTNWNKGQLKFLYHNNTEGDF